MRAKLAAHPLFEELTEDELAGDAAAALLETDTEEGKKVARNGGKTWRAVFKRRRVAAPAAG
jgi:tRNA (guanine-N7-)-methyltransferase